MSVNPARADLAAWKARASTNPYLDDRQLRAILVRALEPDRLAALDERASVLAQAVVSVVGPAAQRYEQRLHQPELVHFDGFGERTEDVRFDATHDETGVVLWRSGIVSYSGEAGRAYEQATLLYLWSLEGEAGHACAATCSIALARALRRASAPPVRDRFLPGLLNANYHGAARGAQFLTEVQGGSDVGANECVAVANGDGETFRVTGEKWFCSVANADQFFVTARVPDGGPGTRGLGSFIVPRSVDGHPNGFSIRRLKDKLGTRSMASGEIDFEGALAWPVGPLEEGFRTAVSVVLNTSRWMTSVGSAGMMRRAVVEATSFAHYRQAFGVPIEEFPAVRRILADMIAVANGALHLVFALTGLEDLVDADRASDDDRLYYRFLVNAAKYITSRQATTVVRSGIEILGGNGTIEDFSVLPRLYRDAIVYESWEGTHNVLASQVLNDMRRMPIGDVVHARLGAQLDGATLGSDHAEVRVRLDELWALARRCQHEPNFGAWHFRDVLDEWALLAEVVYLFAGGEGDSATHLWQSLRATYRPDRDDQLVPRVNALIESLSVSSS